LYNDLEEGQKFQKRHGGFESPCVGPRSSSQASQKQKKALLDGKIMLKFLWNILGLGG
jgi:hypothetical protein